MDLALYVRISLVMFLEFAIWGAWLPVLATRLLGPLKFTGKQTGWIYATLPLACIVSPLIAGQLADKWINTEYLLLGAHLAGAVLMFLAARQTKFGRLFIIMLFYSVFYAATLPLVNSVLFAHISDVGLQGKVFIWAPIAWALIGYFLTGWRWVFKTGEQGRDCLYLAAVLSVIMGVCCLFLPATPAARAGTAPILKVLSMLGEANFLVFVLVSVVGAGLMQVYFMGTAHFMQEMGVPNKNVPASMAIAQVVQAVATYFLMVLLIQNAGYKWTLVVGALCWALLYVIYVGGKPTWLIVTAQSLHGLAYVFFIIVGQIFANSVAPEESRSSMQALIFAATTGVGMYLGTQFGGAVMDKFKKDGKFQWRRIFMLPGAIMIVCAVVLAILFKG